MGAFVKATAISTPVWTIVFYRSVFLTCFVGGLMVIRKTPLTVHNPKLLLLRCIFGFSALVCYFTAIALIPLADAITLQRSFPIWIALLSGVLLGEKTPWAMVACILAAFVGAGLIVSPDLQDIDPYALVALASAVLSAFAYLSIRALRNWDQPMVIVFYFGLFSLLASTPMAIYTGLLPPSDQWLNLMAVGAFALGGQITMTHAYRFAHPAFIGAFSYGGIIVGVLIGMMIFEESVPLMTGIGIALVILSGIALTRVRSEQDAQGEEAGNKV